jgi:cell division septation protein DedD
MNKEELQKACSNLIGVSSSEKELAFEVLQQKILEVIHKDGEAIRINELGVFQYKENPETKTAELIFSQISNKPNSKTLFIRLPVKKTDYSETSLEDVFSLSVGKPVVPINSSYESGSDSETSFIFIRKKIEERVSEILQQSEVLSDFNLWDDYLKTTNDKNESKSIEESSESVLNELTQPDEESESKSDDESLLEAFVSESELYSFPTDSAEQETEIDELFNDLETFKNLEAQESISTQEIFDETISEVGISDDEVDQDIQSEGNQSSFSDDDASEIKLNKDDVFDLDRAIFSESDDSKKFDWNWGDELKKDIPDFEETNSEPAEIKSKKVTTKEVELISKSTQESSEIDNDPFGTLEQTLQLDPEFKKLTGELTDDIDYGRMRDDEYRITNLSKPRPVPPTKVKTRFTRLTSPLEEYNSPQEETLSKKTTEKTKVSTKSYRSFRDRNSTANMFVIGGIVVILAAIIYFAFSMGDAPTKEVLTPTQNNIINSERETDVVTSEPRQTVTPQEEKPVQPTDQQRTAAARDNTSQVEEIRISNLIFRRGNEYNVQVSSWRSPIKAEEEMKRLKARGYNAFIVQAYLPSKGGTWHRVRIGGFKSESEARNFLNNTQL